MGADRFVSSLARSRPDRPVATDPAADALRLAMAADLARMAMGFPDTTTIARPTATAGPAAARPGPSGSHRV
jgi:hypothetical protein